MDKEKNKRLVEALLEEKARLPEINSFGQSNNFKDYDYAIHYLETGEVIPKGIKVYDYDILSACIDDYNALYETYVEE